MAQGEIYDLLKTNPNKWFTTKEINNKLNLGRTSVSSGLRKLLKHKEIEYQENAGGYFKGFHYRTFRFKK